VSDLPMHPSSATLLDAILRVRRAVIILLHILLICVANALALLLRFDGQVPPDYVEIAINWLPSLVAIRLLFLWRLRLFEGLWKYTGLWDLRNIVLAVSSSSGLLLVVAYIVSGDTRYPRSVYIIDAILLICLMSAVRLSRRIYRELVRSPGSRRVLIYGAGNAGEMIVRDMRQNAAFNADPIGFIDDDPHKTGQRIHGVPVLGTRDCLADIVGRKVPDDVIIAIPSAPREVLRGIVRALEQYKVRISTIPRMSDVIGTRVSLTDIRQLNVEDLLSRAPIGLDSRRVRDFLHRRRVLVTGAGGSIGSELCRQIALAEPSSL
jgi:FlaA1/EpsC-like NDP-sugar epimerase